MRALILLAAVLVGACADKGAGPRALAGADPQRGLAEIRRVGCAACHAIPGVAWPKGVVGGSLEGFGDRPLIAGRHPNQPAVLVAWLRDASSLSPGTGMPPMPLDECQARDVAAYLYTLDDR